MSEPQDTTAAAPSTTPSAPPVAQRVPTVRTHHGHEFVDHYEWLRDKSSEAVLEHLRAENAWTEAQTAHLSTLRESIYGEIKSRVQETDMSVPVRDGGWWYFGRTVEGKQYGLQCRLPVTDPTSWEPPTIEPGQTLPGEEVLLDANHEAEGHDFFAIGSLDVSDDGTRLLWAIDTDGDERYELRVRDIASGNQLGEAIPNTAAGASFSPDGEYFYYTTVDDAWRPDKVWRHKVGDPAGTSVLIHHEPDERFWVGMGMTRSRRYLVLSMSSKITSEVRLLDMHEPEGEFRTVWPREHGVDYEVEHAVLGGEDWLLILHNKGAQNFTLVAEPASTQTPGRIGDPTRRRPVIQHDHDIRLEDVTAFQHHLVIAYRRQALPRLATLPIDQQLSADEIFESFEPHEISFEEPLSSVWMSGNSEWDQPMLRIGYTSFATPSTIYDYVFDGGELLLRKQQAVLGTYHPDDYEQHREWAIAADGTRIPISLIWRRDLVQPGTPAPLVLYGYGAYEISIDPSFSVSRLSLLDRGAIWAVAHVRGGGELGRHWYEDGKEATKPNSFSDFVAVARHLQANGWTTPERTVAIGGSAGGLLVGAAINLAPDAFGGVLADVPFVDPLTSILDPSLPLTVIEWDEWGNPLANPEVYELMRGYSPYEGVRDGVSYPRILATTSLNDTRVLYVEPAKWVARLREVHAPVLLKTEMSAGHGGVSGRYEAWKQTAFEYAWVLDVLGLADTAPVPSPSA